LPELPVQGIVGGVEIEDDLFGRLSFCRSLGVRVQEQIEEQPLDLSRIVADLVAAGRDLARKFEPVQRRFAGGGRAIGPFRRKLAGQCRHDPCRPGIPGRGN